MNVTIMIPSLNPDEKMVRTVQGLVEEGFTDILVVNDGSGDEFLKPFETVAAMPGVTVLTHEVNKGKGRAMKTAFAYILENRPETAGVVTVDADGQHLPKDIKACAEAMLEQKDKVVLGVRDFSKPDVPFKSRNGNNITKAVFRLLCGIRCSDTQTGLRAIPTEYLPLMCEIQGERYEYETNQLLELHDHRIDMHEVVIETVYIDDNASSHFHPVRDSFKIYKVIFKHVATGLAGRFIGSSGLCFLVDTLLFYLINVLVGKTTSVSGEVRIGIATVGSRAVSTVLNYCLNRKLVFRSEESGKKTLLRYYLLAICQMTVSMLLVDVVAEKLLGLKAGLLESIIKFCVDVVLFFFSYRIQKYWVFAPDKKKEQQND